MSTLEIVNQIIGKEPQIARQILVDGGVPLNLACQITTEYYHNGVIAGDPAVIRQAIKKLMNLDIDEAKFREEMIISIETKTDGFEDMPWSLIPTYALQTVYGYVLKG